MRIESATLMAHTATLLQEADAESMRDHIVLMEAQLDECEDPEELAALADNIATLENVAERLAAEPQQEATETPDAGAETGTDGTELDEQGRVPAGSPHGGEFAKGNTAGAGGTAAPASASGASALSKATDTALAHIKKAEGKAGAAAHGDITNATNSLQDARKAISHADTPLYLHVKADLNDAISHLLNASTTADGKRASTKLGAARKSLDVVKSKVSQFKTSADSGNQRASVSGNDKGAMRSAASRAAFGTPRTNVGNFGRSEAAADEILSNHEDADMNILTEAEDQALFEEKFSFDEIAGKLRTAAATKWSDYSSYPRDVYPDEVVFSVHKIRKQDAPYTDEPSKLLKCSYTMDKDGNVTLGEPVEVKARMTYAPVDTTSAGSPKTESTEGEQVETPPAVAEVEPAEDAVAAEEASMAPTCPSCHSTKVAALADDATKMKCAACGKVFDAPKGKAVAPKPAGTGFQPKKPMKETNAEFLDSDDPNVQEILEAAADGLIELVESCAFNLGDVFEVVEGKRVVRSDGSVNLKLIQPGWGSSGYYSAAMLEKCGPKVFKKGTKMYWDHPTKTAEAEHPERSLRDLSAVLLEDAKWNPQGKAGAGLYADAKVFKSYQPYVEEMAPHIGVSIRAMGRAKEGKAEGREGAIIEELAHAKSVDFVTTPGAGGQIVNLFEAARERVPFVEAAAGIDLTEFTTQSAAGDQPNIQESSQEEEPMTEAQQKDFDALQESDRAKTALLESQAQTIAMLQAERQVDAMIAGAHLPEATATRLRESLLGTEEAPKALPLTEAKILDRAKLKETAEAALKVETEYLESVGAIGQGSARIIGMGASTDFDEAADYSTGEKLEEANSQLEEALSEICISPAHGKLAAAGRK